MCAVLLGVPENVGPAAALAVTQREDESLRIPLTCLRDQLDSVRLVSGQRVVTRVKQVHHDQVESDAGLCEDVPGVDNARRIAPDHLPAQSLEMVAEATLDGCPVLFLVVDEQRLNRLHVKLLSRSASSWTP